MTPSFLLTLPLLLYLAAGLSAAALQRRPAGARITAGLLSGAAAIAGMAIAVPVLLGAPGYAAVLLQPTPFITAGLRLDALSAWFVLLLSAVALAVSVAGLDYARAYDHDGGPRLAAATAVFVGAMLLVLLADGIFVFLLAWELMALASYLLVVHEHHEPSVRRAGFVYLAMTHLGTAFLLVAFLLLFVPSGAWDFASLRASAGALDPPVRTAIFVLTLIGCGTKAGIVPLHVWLPRAHPVAPSHVSALMSGVMLKVGLYAFIRVVWDVLGGGSPWWGVVVLAVGLATAVLGVLYALMEHELKRLLAFSSIENVGIVLIGVGAGMVLHALGQRQAAALALAAGLFHALNHALFKALLFLGAGAIQQATGTKDLEELGGLIRRMPQTAVLFLIGSAAISALPPLNGFASEWLTFQALLALGATRIDGWGATGAGVAAGLLGLTGALTAACFVKAFGVAFLALPRSAAAAAAAEAPALLRGGMALLAAACAALGLLPGAAGALLAAPTSALTGAPLALAGLPTLRGPDTLVAPPILAGALLALAGLAVLVARLGGPRLPARTVPTWACGFALRPEMQYGSSAFAKPIRLFFRAIVRPERAVEAEYALAPYFAVRLRTHGGIQPVFERHMYGPTAAALLRAAAIARTLQNGSVRLYLAYILATLVALLVWPR